MSDTFDTACHEETTSASLSLLECEATRSTLSELETATGVPAFVVDSSGDILVRSKDAAQVCHALQQRPEARSLIAVDDGGITCEFTSCPLHSRCSTCPITNPALPEPPSLHLVHCIGNEAVKGSANIITVTLQDEAEKDDLMGALSASFEELHLLQSLASAFEEEIDHRMTFVRILDCVKQVLPFDAAEVWVHHASDKEYRCLLHQEGQSVNKSLETIQARTDLDDKVRELGPRIIRKDKEDVDDLDHFLRSFLKNVRLPAAMIPLVNRSRMLGMLILQHPPSLERLDSARLRTLATVGRQTSLVLQVQILIDELRANEGLRREIDIARQIQHSLLPQTIPDGPCYDLFAGCVTAARVGGDYYDFFRTGESELGMLIADVSGHSVASGLVAMSFRSSFRHFLYEQNIQLPDIFGRVNRALQGELSQTGHFLSAIYGTLDERDRTFRYVNAGHHPPLVYNTHEDSFKTLEEIGLLIGVLPEWQYVAAKTKLEPGDVLLLYTDGIVEAENQNGEMFGADRLRNAVRKHYKKGAKPMYHYLLREVYVFQDEQYNQDDITLLILKIH